MTTRFDAARRRLAEQRRDAALDAACRAVAVLQARGVRALALAEAVDAADLR